MSCIGFSFLHFAVAGESLRPGFSADFFRGDEVTKVDRCLGLPDALWPPEIRNTGFRGNSGAGKGDDAATFPDQGPQFSDLMGNSFRIEVSLIVHVCLPLALAVEHTPAET